MGGGVDEVFDIGSFGDARRAASGAFLLERVVTMGSLVVRQVGGDRAGEMSVHRFLSSPAVTVEEIVATAGRRTAQACAGRRIVAVQDTTEVNFAGRSRARRGLGPAGDGRTPGFFLHAVIAVEAEDEALLGVIDARPWTRRPGRVAARRLRPLAEKESQRWLDGNAAAAARLGTAASVVMVSDRESDIYGAFAHRPPTLDLIVRAAQNRAVPDGDRLFSAAARWPALGGMAVRVAPSRPGDRGRTARVVLRAGVVRIARPRNGADPNDPPELTLGFVEAREIDPPAGVKPLLWRLLTTLPVATLADAIEIVRLYRLRWRIEQVFRALKSDGLDLEAVQMQDAARLFKLAAVALVAAGRTQQLVDARAGGARPATDVLDADLIRAAAAIGRSKEGATARQKNPHAEGSLSWLAWIIARLGGWNCYYKPPGPKTMRQGWDQFAAMAAGFMLAAHALVL
jgi:Transposase DDE domain